MTPGLEHVLHVESGTEVYFVGGQRIEIDGRYFYRDVASAARDSLTQGTGIILTGGDDVLEIATDPAYHTRNISGHRIGSGGLPVITLGTGAGTGAVVNVALPGAQPNVDEAGIIDITTGTTPTASATVVTVTFSTPYSAIPRAVLLTPASTRAKLLYDTQQVVVSASSVTAAAFLVVAGTVGLTASVNYRWFYHVIG